MNGQPSSVLQIVPWKAVAFQGEILKSENFVNIFIWFLLISIFEFGKLGWGRAGKILNIIRSRSGVAHLCVVCLPEHCL